MKITENIPYGPLADQQLADVYLPEGETKAVFVYFHGGGLEAGSRKDCKVFASYLTARGVAIVSVEYRMYPDARYPAFIEDAATSVAWAQSHMPTLCGCEHIYVGGSSAGAYLSMMLCFDSKYLTQVGVSPESIRGYFHDAGQPTAHFNVLKHTGIDPRRVIVDETAVLYHVGKEDSYPRMRFIVSDHDMAGRYEQTMLMLATLRHFGFENFDHIVMQGTHCHYCRMLDENGESVFGKMLCNFLLK